ncbi:hypothetical protein, partial [Bacteroides ovatus]
TASPLPVCKAIQHLFQLFCIAALLFSSMSQSRHFNKETIVSERLQKFGIHFFFLNGPNPVLQTVQQIELHILTFPKFVLTLI